MNPNKQMLEEIGAQAATLTPPKLDPQVAELFKALENELGRMRKRIFALEEEISPIRDMVSKAVDYELGKRGLERTKHNEFMALNCEASAWEQFRHKYNV